MTAVLLTFLGRVSKKDEGTYRKTRYDFGGGDISEPVAFFGWQLQKRVSSDRMIILGTAGSMWDHLSEGDLPFGEDFEEIRLRLLEATEKKRVTNAHLVPLQEPLSRLQDCDLRLRIIPYCRNEREQIKLLNIMAEYIEPGDEVHIDISHGFRHLPMIALLAALHLRVVRNAKISGIWYGSFDPDTGDAPVYNLVGLLRIADWIQALHTYDKDGDYGVFAPLLGPAGEMLRRAAYFERTTNPVKAREALIGWANREDRCPADDPAAELFRNELEDRIHWIRHRDRASWEASLARRYLVQRDYVRAVVYGFESVISADVARSDRNPGDRTWRETSKESLLQSGRDRFPDLNKLRNTLAHGVLPADRRVARILKDEAGLREELEELFGLLLNDIP